MKYLNKSFSVYMGNDNYDKINWYHNKAEKTDFCLNHAWEMHIDGLSSTIWKCVHCGKQVFSDPFATGGSSAHV